MRSPALQKGYWVMQATGGEREIQWFETNIANQAVDCDEFSPERAAPAGTPASPSVALPHACWCTNPLCEPFLFWRTCKKPHSYLFSSAYIPIADSSHPTWTLG